MLRKILFTMLALVMLLGTMSASSITNPYFPPNYIYADTESCSFTWVDDDFNPVTVTGIGRGHWTGAWNHLLYQFSCSTRIDFNDPGFASLDQVCPLVPLLCKGNGSFSMDQNDGLVCLASNFYTLKSSLKISSNGKVNVSCDFLCCELP